MRPKVTARKSSGGRLTGRHYSFQQYQFLENLRTFQHQNQVLEQTTDAEGRVDRTNVASNNNSKQVLNIIKIIPINAMSSGIEDNSIITAAVGLNDPHRLEQLPVSVVPLRQTEMFDEIREPTAETRQKTADTNFIRSTPPTPSDLKGSPDNIPLSERASLNFTPKRMRVATDESAVNEGKKFKLTSTSPSSQTRRYTTRTLSKQENSCKKLIEKYDKNILFKMLLEELDGEEILEGYKEKRNDWTNQKINEETFKVLNVKFQANNSTDSSKLASVQNILKEFSNLVGDNLVEAMLQMFGDQLSAPKALEYLKVDDVVAALCQKYTAAELLNLVQTADPFVPQKMLEMTSADAIIDSIKSRKDLKTSEPLLTVLLESVSQMVPEEQNENVERTIDVNTDSKVAMTTAVYNLVESKEYLKNSEVLLNVMLTNGPKKLSNETKRNVKNVLTKKFSASELNDLSHEVISFHLAQKVVEVENND